LFAQAEDSANSEVLHSLHDLHCICDSDRYGIWGIFASAILYVGFALYQEYVNGGNKRIVYIKSDETTSSVRPLRPQSGEEVQVTHPDTASIGLGTPETQTQNVKFVDIHPGFTHEQKGNFDAVRDHAFIQDARLQDFFQRPVLIQSAEWDVSSGLSQVSFDPWTLFFEDPKVLNRLANYRLLRCKLHIKVTISASPFHYGRVMVDYLPRHTVDDYTSVRSPYIDPDYVLVSQRPHICLNPSESEGGEMILPFFYEKNAIDITLSEWNQMGQLTMSEFSPLKSASSTTDPVTINVFAWAEDVKFAIPTSSHPTLAPQSTGDEYEKKPFSYKAGVVAAAANRLNTIPVIGPFARATEIGAQAAGAMATLFGFSRPNDLEIVQHRPRTKTSFAITNAKDDCEKLTVDGKQELSIDPRLAGLENVDELGINYIASKESYYGSFDWATTDAPETPLFAEIVDPGINQKVIATNTEYYLPAMAFASLPFKYWRGSIKFRFVVVASKYHRGRLKIVYDPVKHNVAPDYNEAYTTIVDIGETKDFTITCGWGQNSSYREVKPINDLHTASSYTSGIGGTENFGNGSLSVYVVNELSHPDVSCDVEVKVFVSAGEDFEVAKPDSTYLQGVRISEVQPDELLKPQSGEEVVLDDRKHADTHGNKSDLSDNTNLVYFGESIRSFRSLLKRYSASRLLRSTSSTSTDPIAIEWALDVFPPYPSRYPTSPAGQFTFSDSGTRQHYSGVVHLMNYLSIAYTGWRGSIRYMADFSGFPDFGGYGKAQVASISRRAGPATESLSTLTRASMFTSTTISDNLNFLQQHAGFDGKVIEVPEVQPMPCAEIPFYSEKRFLPAKKRFVPGTATPDMDQAVITCDYTPTGSRREFLTVHNAVGEDFTFFFYTGPPRLFYTVDTW
jgi:hypothetical protein